MADTDTPSVELASNAKQPGVMFDSQLVELFHPTIDKAFMDYADVLRSVLVVFDYYGSLNDAPDLNKAIWLGPQGAQQEPAGIIGSIGASLQATAHMLDRAFLLRNALREDLEETQKALQTALQALHERKEELEQVKKELEERGGVSGGASE